MATKNDVAWDILFNQLPIVQTVNSQGHFDITSDQINTISGRQARLMAKIDFKTDLPNAMANNNYAMLAIKDGLYRIGVFDPFININQTPSSKAKFTTFPNNIITIDPFNIKGESEVLEAALMSGILDDVFGENVKLTIRGRSSDYPHFNFSLNNVNFNIQGVQIEVDGGYEGNTTINLVEAKSFAPNTINIRQLIYPQMGWENIIKSRKIVRTYICLYQKPFIRFIPIDFTNGTCKADHANEKVFTFSPPAKLNIRAIPMNANAIPPNPNAPFPQANRLDKALAMFTNAVNITKETSVITKQEFVEDFDVSLDPRDIDYYFNVLKWLGLMDSLKGLITVTEFGKKFDKLNINEQMETLANIIFCEPIFHHTLHHRQDSMPDSYFKRWRITQSTKYRRLQTVKAWIKYFDDYVDGLL